MTNNPLPAALASIKRYDIDVYGNAHEREGGAWMAAVDVLATPPPPADGAVAWAIALPDGTVDAPGWMPMKHLEPFKKIAVMKDGCEIVLAYRAAPPDDSAMVEALRTALRDLVNINEEHNKAIEKIIGRQPGWNDSYLDNARTLLAGRK